MKDNVFQKNFHVESFVKFLVCADICCDLYIFEILYYCLALPELEYRITIKRNIYFFSM